MLLTAFILLSVCFVADGKSQEVYLELWYVSEGDDLSGNDLPDRIIMNLPVEEHFVSLNLTKEKENVEILPVRVPKRKPDKNGHYSMYSDVSKEVSLSMAVDSEGSVLYATFPHNGKVYDLLPASDVTSDHVVTNEITINRTEYVVVKETVSTNYKDDAVDPKLKGRTSVLNKLDGAINSKLFPKNQKRNLTVEIYLVLDHSIFMRWYKLRNNDTQESVRHIMYYYLNVINGVKQRYESINVTEFHLSAALAGFYIALKEESAPFSEIFKAKGTLPVSDYVLLSFNLWTKDRKFPRHDVIALITGAQQGSVNGMGYVGTACTEMGISVTRDNGPFQTADTLTHEIGHNLGANHDGLDNDCVENIHYIMTAKRKISSDLVYGNEYLFSECSKEYFKQYIKQLDENETNCLADIPQSDNSFQNKRLKHPGLIYSLDEQCALVYGVGSHFCAGAAREREMCMGISCYEPDIGTCDPLYSLRPADGTSCGNKKWCIQGRCIYNEDAKEFKDHCMFGNHKHSHFGAQCEKLLNESNHWCYEELVRNDCCESCGARKRNVEGCEYGDVMPFACSIMTRPEDCEELRLHEKCCETCNDPEKLKALLELLKNKHQK